MEKLYLKILERIELQQKALWWDNLLFFMWVFSLIVGLAGLVIKNISFPMWSFFIFVASTILTQIAEKREFKKIREFYQNARKKIQT